MHKHVLQGIANGDEVVSCEDLSAIAVNLLHVIGPDTNWQE